MSLTSYRYAGVELNDGVNFLVPLADTTFDDPNPATETFAYRKDNTPVSTGITLSEGVFTIPINIRPAHGATFEARVQTLRRIFSTRGRYVKFERRLPHEQNYTYIYAAPRELTIDRLNRKAAVTMHAEDRTWRTDAETSAQQNLFENGEFAEYMNVNYAGNDAVEPIIEITALTPGTASQIPLYYRELTLWADGSQATIGRPIKIVDNWDCTTIPTTKMREDGFDISVTLPDGTALKRLILGNRQFRDIWILPHTWPTTPQLLLRQGPGAGEFPRTGLKATDMVMYLEGGELGLPASGTLRVDDEFITYSGVSTYSDGLTTFTRLTITQRGALGTTAALHYDFYPVLRPYTVRVNYGYAQGYEWSYGNDYAGWPLLDYTQSTNSEWVQTDNVANWANGNTDQTSAWMVHEPSPSPHTAAENCRATISVDGNRRGLETFLATGRSGFGWVRLVLPVHNLPPRQTLTANITFLLRNGEVGRPAKVRLRAIRGAYGSPWEKRDLLWQNDYTFAQDGVISTGWLTVRHPGQELTHLAVELDGVPSGGWKQVVQIEQTRLRMVAPFAGALGNEGGLGYGQFPVYVSIHNQSDPGSVPFVVETMLAVNQTATIDCFARTVSSGRLSDVSYKNSTWLRLLPGNNALYLGGRSGVADCTVRLRWKNRY